MEPRVITSRAELKSHLAKLPGRLGLVMTMGALHDGHLSLIEEAKKHADHVLVTVFVNPTQFAPGEDFDKYPRDLDADVAAISQVGADLVFAPAASEIYHSQASVSINPGPSALVLEGKTRPTHFAGVLLVVHKMFNLTGAHVAVFGQKDAQQLALIKQMVRDLDMPIQIVAAPIVRAKDGLALSSRNAYLSSLERDRALFLSRGLQLGVQLAEAGANTQVIQESVTRAIEEGGVQVDYVELVDPTTFAPVSKGEAVLAVAGYVGRTRLIDNVILTVQGEDDE